MQHVEAVIDELVEHGHACRLARPEEADDLDFASRLAPELVENRRDRLSLLLRAGQRTILRRVGHHEHAQRPPRKDRRLGQGREICPQLPGQAAHGAQEFCSIELLSLP